MVVVEMDGVQLAPLIDATEFPPGPIMLTVTPVAARLPVFWAVTVITPVAPLMSACVIWMLALGAEWRIMGITTPKTMVTATMAMATRSIVDTTLLIAFLRVFLLNRGTLCVCIPVRG